VLKGTGTRFVGDNISHFGGKDMVFTGSNVPHVWRSDEKYFKNHKLGTHCIVIYFSPNFMGEDFLNKEEMIKVRELMKRADRGLEVTGKTMQSVRQIMKSMLHQKSFDGVISLMQILHLLATSDEVKYINKEGYLNAVTDADSERMRAVHACILDNYKDDIRLEDENRPVIKLDFEAGYKTIYHFLIKFKEIIGSTPQQYREAYGKIRA
jgi:AraC-like DNA-binding protein